MIIIWSLHIKIAFVMAYDLNIIKTCIPMTYEVNCKFIHFFFFLLDYYNLDSYYYLYISLKISLYCCMKKSDKNYI